MVPVMVTVSLTKQSLIFFRIDQSRYRLGTWYSRSSMFSMPVSSFRISAFLGPIPLRYCTLSLSKLFLFFGNIHNRVRYLHIPVVRGVKICIASTLFPGCYLTNFCPAFNNFTIIAEYCNCQVLTRNGFNLAFNYVSLFVGKEIPEVEKKPLDQKNDCDNAGNL